MLGVFFGIKILCALPLEQLHSSDVSILPDITDPDPFYMLPIAAAVLMNAQLSVSASMVLAFFAYADVSRCLGHLYPANGPISICEYPFMTALD